MPFPLPAEPYMPHRLPMRLVEWLLSCNEETAAVEALVTEGNLLLDPDGRLEPLTAVELLAQAQAVAHGYRSQQRDKPVRMGYLVGVSNFELFDCARIGERLRIQVATTTEMGDFALIEGDIRAGERLLAKGTLKLWIQSAKEDHV